MHRSRFLALLLIALVPLTASAQQQPPPQQQQTAQQQAQRRRVSLKEALQLAAKQGPDVLASRAQAAIARVGVRRAWTAWQPDLSATGIYDHSSTELVLPPNTFGPRQTAPITVLARNTATGTLQLSQPFLSPQGLFLPGIANAAAEAADRGADEAREQSLLGVARTYLNLQGLSGLLDAAREAERVALRREQDARARIAAGTDVEIALLRAQTETAQARAQIANLVGQIDGFLPLLEALVGEPVEPTPTIVTELRTGGDERSEPWQQAFAVKSAAAQVLSLSRSVNYDNFLWLPTVAGVARGNYNSTGGFAGQAFTYDLIVNVTIPLYDRGVRYAQKSEDEARLAQAQANLASARARARANWIGSRANLLAAQAVLQQSEAQAQLATRTQAQVEASARAGVATSLDLSDADQRKFAAQSAAAQARAAVEVRRAEIAAAEGALFDLTR
jgi:outer membrane protein TolC